MAQSIFTALAPGELALKWWGRPLFLRCPDLSFAGFFFFPFSVASRAILRRSPDPVGNVAKPPHGQLDHVGGTIVQRQAPPRDPPQEFAIIESTHRSIGQHTKTNEHVACDHEHHGATRETHGTETVFIAQTSCPPPIARRAESRRRRTTTTTKTTTTTTTKR